MMINKITKAAMLLSLLLSCMITSSKALSGHDIGERESEIISNISITRFDDTYEKISINCFDISENGDIAICNSGEVLSNIKTILVLDGNGNFKYGYRVKIYGTLLIEYDEDMLTLYFVRSDIKVWIKENGEIQSIMRIEETPDNEKHVHGYMLYPIKSKDGSSYKLSSDAAVYTFFTSEYSQILKKPANSNQQEDIEVIYNDNGKLKQTQKRIVIFILILISYGVIVFFIHILAYRTIRKKIKPYKPRF